MEIVNKNLIVIANGFNAPSGPSVTLFHLLRGISRYFARVYVVSTIQENQRASSPWFESFLPQNVYILHIPRLKTSQTIYYGLSENSRMSIGTMLKEILQKLSKKYRDGKLYLYLASDVFNLLSLSMSCRSEDGFLTGYNVLFNMAPLPILVKSVKGLVVESIVENIKNSILSLACEYIDSIATPYIRKILAHTNYQRYLYITYRNIDENKIIVFPHLIDRDLIIKVSGLKALKSRNDRDTGECRLVFVGRLVSEKGLHILLKAFSKVVKKGYNAKLTIVGDGPLRILLMKYRKRLGEKLVWYGKTRYPETVKIKIIANSDILVLPSLNELFGFVILEALSLNKRVIASRVGGIPEILSPKCGSLVTPGDVDSLADTIIYECENLQTNDQDYCNEFMKRFDVKYRSEEFVEIIEKYGEFNEFCTK